MEKNKNHDEPVVVYSGTIWEAGMVKSLLENAEIEALLMDEFTGTLAPWYTAGGGAGAVKVVVAERVRDIAGHSPNYISAFHGSDQISSTGSSVQD